MQEYSLTNTQLWYYVQHENMKYAHDLKKIERRPYQIIKKAKIIKNQLEILWLNKQYPNKLLIGMKTSLLLKMQINFALMKAICSST